MMLQLFSIISVISILHFNEGKTEVFPMNYIYFKNISYVGNIFLSSMIWGYGSVLIASLWV